MTVVYCEELDEILILSNSPEEEPLDFTDIFIGRDSEVHDQANVDILERYTFVFLGWL